MFVIQIIVNKQMQFNFRKKAHAKNKQSWKSCFILFQHEQPTDKI